MLSSKAFDFALTGLTVYHSLPPSVPLLQMSSGCSSSPDPEQEAFLHVTNVYVSLACKMVDRLDLNMEILYSLIDIWPPQIFLANPLFLFCVDLGPQASIGKELCLSARTSALHAQGPRLSLQFSS